MIIPAAEVEKLAREAGVDVARFMTTLLPRAAEFARPPISNFKVGCVSRGLSGALYFGANVEFAPK
jgi:cytidine deaminase